MRRTLWLMLSVLILLMTSQVQAANGRISRLQISSACPAWTVTSSGQTVRLSSACLNSYSIRVNHTGAGTTPHTYKLVWDGGTLGPVSSYNSYYQFNNLSGPATYTVFIDEGNGGESWTVGVAVATASATLTVLSPNGGETWTTGSVATVNWTSGGLSAYSYVRIRLNRAYPAGLWETIAASTINDGVHSFPLTGVASTTARVQIISTTYPSVGDTSNADFNIAASSITVLAPNGGESLTLGNTYDITWTSSGLPGENVKIEVKRGYPAGIWEILEASAPNTGNWSWPLTGLATPAARIRITGTVHTTVSDTSNASFAITGVGTTPTVTVVLPNGGEYWPVGSTHEILWTSTDLTENVRIELNRAFGTDWWEDITPSTPNDGVYEWYVTGSVTATGRIRISGTVSTNVSDISDAMFTVSGSGSGGPITVITPNGGEYWPIGTTHDITWSAPALTGNVRIDIKRVYPAGSWTWLITSTANDGLYSWRATPSATTGARVRVSSVTNPITHDVSDGNFTIASATLRGEPGTVDDSSPFEGPLPTAAYLAPNYPNPFNPTTTFEFGVPEAMRVSLKVYDVTGREVATLLESSVAAGRHRVTWECAECSAGVYLVVLSGDGFHFVQKATFLK